MSHCPFCSADSAPTAKEPQRSSIIRRIWHGVHWVLPTTLLVLTPKCPMCVAGYIVMFTGVGVTLTTARYVWILTPVLCVIWLAYLSCRAFRNQTGAFWLSLKRYARR